MTVKKLTETLSVSTFVPPAKLARAAAGFRTVINNRPDCEEPGQPSSESIAQAAREVGLDYVHIPVVPGQIGASDVDKFAGALDQHEGPVLAFCRTGTRSTMLWALSQAGQRSADEIIATAKEAGYDIEALRPKLEQGAAA